MVAVRARAMIVGLLLAAGVVGAPTSTCAADLPALDPRVDVEALEFELSLPTEEDDAQWLQPGFRMSLGYLRGHAHGLAAAPGLGTDAVEARFGARLDARWSLLANLQYALTRGKRGARFLGGIEPTVHLWRGLSLGVGVGVAVVVLPRYRELDPSTATLVATRTVDPAEDILGACSGDGVHAHLRLEYQFVLGERFATGPSARAGWLWVGCEEDLERTDPDSAKGVRLRQFWTHVDWSLGWVLAWR